LLLSPVAISQKCNPQDKKALLQIKKELNNSSLLDSWDPHTGCCGWVWIDCDTNNRVWWLVIQSPDVPNNNIVGHIPPSVGDLPSLERLEFLNFPKITGPIPSTIAKLKNLKYLTISGTNVFGPVPSFLGQLKNLELIDLSSNKLTGTIPSSFSQLPKIDTLNLANNKLTGPIPNSFGSFKKPSPDIYLFNNRLSGSIPASLGQIDLERLDLSRNRFVGDASMLFGSNKRLQYLDLSRNLFSFDFSKVDFPKKSLTILNLNHNNIYGKIPPAVTKVEDFREFNVSYNLLCGEIPQGGYLHTRFDVFSYYHNKCLCGSPLPKCK
jgi:Leucine-rich repeat (LRR) protein